MSINKGMDKEGGVYIYIYTVEDYSAIKKNEIRPFAATWVDLESVILSEVSQTERRNVTWYPAYGDSKKK